MKQVLAFLLVCLMTVQLVSAQGNHYEPYTHAQSFTYVLGQDTVDWYKPPEIAWRDSSYLSYVEMHNATLSFVACMNELDEEFNFSVVAVVYNPAGEEFDSATLYLGQNVTFQTGWDMAVSESSGDIKINLGHQYEFKWTDGPEPEITVLTLTVETSSEWTFIWYDRPTTTSVSREFNWFSVVLLSIAVLCIVVPIRVAQEVKKRKEGGVQN